jgi:hypothetical protein
MAICVKHQIDPCRCAPTPNTGHHIGKPAPWHVSDLPGLEHELHIILLRVQPHMANRASQENRAI